MRLDEVRNLNHGDDFIFAIAVGIDHGFPHCALLYNWDDGRIRTIDFYDQCIRSSQSIGDFSSRDYIFVLYNEEAIIEPFALQVPSICELIKEQNNRISFGIGFTETKFNDEGKLIFANGDFGLTCATFILAVLKRAQIILIELSDWQKRPNDLEWQEIVLEIYKKINKKNPEEYTEALIEHYTQNLNCFRYRPEEVAAASAAPELPTNFNYCSEYGSQVIIALTDGLDYYNMFYA